MTNQYEAVGLKAKEYEGIVEMLGREPNELELNLYGVMWSEHCSYKHSRSMFKHFPTSGPSVLQGPGENAGIVDIGDGLAIAMKIESHNHPSAIEPYQGAATGVGGIIRDIFAMGARPIALLNSLRFGELEGDARVKYLLEGVVEGIAGYGNCMGIPTVGGEVYFNQSYRGNPLVNAMCVGLIEHDAIHRGTASGVGNSIMYVGAATGRDGIGGASFASATLTEESEEKRAAVQVGDPFMEKLLLEACLELLKTGSIIGIQDLGAAGLVSACCETATRGEGGMEIDVLKVPRRETGMVPVEVMISESQERMLLIVERGREEEVNEIVKKWGLHSVIIGRVTNDDKLRIFEGDKVVGEIPAESLDSSGAPRYEPDYAPPADLAELQKLDIESIPEPRDLSSTLRKLLASPNIASKEWIYRQYDHMVRTNTVIKPGSDAAVLRIRGTKKGIALTTDCNSRYCYLDPREGSKIAVVEAARNIVCSGGKPIAITDGLNFGSPETPEGYWQFRESVLGLSEACREMDTPVISGNVSFYNQTEKGSIHPTPIVGMVGLIEDISKTCTMAFKEAGDIIVLLGQTKAEIGGSEYLASIHGQEKGKIPHLNLSLEKRLQKEVLALIQGDLVQSAHDLSEGGLAVGVAECAIAGGIGARVEVNTELRNDIVLFSESQSRFLMTIKPEHLETVQERLKQSNIPHEQLGTVIGNELQMQINGNVVVKESIGELEEIWRGALQCLMESMKID
ncbi:phosphoribosylformylglycinamidine synthase II [Alkaliphilus metalliredigens QYMF]|uniref:Phosphoribosylformylglycinamidine synthase subunit PurL n=1 Tax=Alkaliphilus metalliredigens (strain QYMF) TaxID=293826 RepID=PURL_ALKMQ|nr:phosphoribosylformylglycinamidine synthase subunit PurL [Alkaliphilus metalliredigens]A6TLS3.1 RecName: Full=Phosphoribosylformylglycinamidine synthase subunit PurL; Short=FGAM synthase; AltName: Full=Formylglycinamide ribonucleotide amidotransferase subunit II; Short=FGAR amidotransferase II; Short=FGAR-AT II; AltName: Full=Glutamine amidotransferase PurL; AltName: Full=Phosphoribosylformylglycinamidine synthase subunit II [Alkaliphilus metalliredigens QYMF]ABR47141.1 phosphoribosylformylglyc